MDEERRAPGRRQERKLQNRRKLIEATIQLISEVGISGVTVSRVVERAGVSRGLINLHFETKEAMLLEVLDSLTGEWGAAWQEEAQEPSDDPARKLLDLLLISFRPPVFDTARNSAWQCFYADPRFRSTYQERYHETDQAYLECLAELCRQVSGQGLGQSLATARILRAVTGGLWLELLTEPDHFTLEEASEACRLTLLRFFPDHAESFGATQ
ncbi:MAG: TetR family transcriptional regulator C-terminal domain-containing protein [Rhodospirillales bacterium]